MTLPKGFDIIPSLSSEIEGSKSAESLISTAYLADCIVRLRSSHNNPSLTLSEEKDSLKRRTLKEWHYRVSELYNADEEDVDSKQRIP